MNAATSFLFALICALSLTSKIRAFLRPAAPFFVRHSGFVSSSLHSGQSTITQLRLRRSQLYSTGQDTLDPLLLSEKIFDQLFDDILYSGGDIESVQRRNPKVFIHPKFLAFLKQKLGSLNDDDERSVIQGVLGMIAEQVQLSDGLGQDSELLYEKRLDNIVFANPAERKHVLQEMKEDLTVGFINFLQGELRSTKDLDVKVVIAEILHEISELQGGDYLDSSERALIAKGSESANSDAVRETANNLQRLSKLGDRNDQILAGLLFSNNDVVEDIFNNMHYLDDEFMSFLQRKIAATQNLEERNALNSLFQSIKQVTAKMQELEAERLLESVDHEEDLSFEAVKERMKAVQSGPSEGSASATSSSSNEKPKMVDSFSVKATRNETFWSIVKKFESGVSESFPLIDVIRENYALCDFEFIRLLDIESTVARDEGKTDLSRRLLDLRRGINDVMVEQMEAAQGKLANILSKRDPKAIEAEVIRMTRKGEVNEALVLLIEGNIQTAKQENAQGAVQLLSRLLQRIAEEKERKMPEDQKLLRQLLKLTISEKRKEALYNAFKPSRKLNERSGEFETNGPPAVAPPVFIDMVRKFIEDFGNVDSFNIMSLAVQIIDEAQEVATDLYGEGMTPQDQQRMMFEKNTVSVWDLASFEEESMMSGDNVPWRNDEYDGKEVEDVLGERVRRIGGADDDI